MERNKFEEAIYWHHCAYIYIDSSIETFSIVSQDKNILIITFIIFEQSVYNKVDEMFFSMTICIYNACYIFLTDATIQLTKYNSSFNA